MFSFSILKKSTKSSARLGLLETAHGVVETPAFVPVATQATIKTLTSDEAAATGAQLLIANTYHLHVRPGEKVVKVAGGLHDFMNWKRPLMTDSGGFQVFSLGFGKDFGTGKILKERSDEIIRDGQQPKLLAISDDGVRFRSYVDGAELFIGPKESMRIQGALGADIIFAFDECTSPIADRAYTERSLERTHRWANMCLENRSSAQALYGIVQGGKFDDLRRASSQVIGALPFDGFGIGGEFGDDKGTMESMLKVSFEALPQEKPRHLLGIGHLEDIPVVMKAGVDTFDCIVPTQYARRGVAFTSHGRLDMTKKEFLQDLSPLDSACGCSTCAVYTRAYITHLMRAHEITALKLLTFHNLFYFNAYVAKLREDIKNGAI